MNFFEKFMNDELKEESKVEPMNQKSILQGLAETVLNHYSKDAIIAALDFVATLSEDDLKEWTSGMSPEQTERVYRVWRACQLQNVEIKVEAK